MTRRRYHPTPEYVASVGRMIHAAGRRVGAGDPSDLTALANLRGEVEGAIVEAIAGQRAAGVRWVSIGEALGVTKEAVVMRYGPKVRAIAAAGTALVLVAMLAGFTARSTAQPLAPTTYLTLVAGRAMDGQYDPTTGAPVPGVLSLAGAVALDASYGLTTVAGVVTTREANTAPADRYGRDIYSTWDELAPLQASSGLDVISYGDDSDLVGMTPDQVYDHTCGLLSTYVAHGFPDAAAEYAYKDDWYAPNATRTADPNAVYAYNASLGLYQPQDTVGTCYSFGRTYGTTATTATFSSQHGYQQTVSISGGSCAAGLNTCKDGATPTRLYQTPATIEAIIASAPAGSWLSIQFYHLLTGANATGSQQWDCTNADPAQHWTAYVTPDGKRHADSEAYCANDWGAILASVPPSMISATPAQVGTAWAMP